MKKTFKVVVFSFLSISFFWSDLFAVPNFHRVNSAIFRGAKPEGKDFYEFAQKRIKTVISLEEKFSKGRWYNGKYNYYGCSFV